jgi:hypothetical protein
MTFSSRDVTRYVRAEIRPLLENWGFAKFTSRKAWRFLPEIVHEVDIRSLGSYNARRLNTTSHSFSVDIGIAYLPASKYPWFEWLHSKDPPPYACQARKSLRKRISQPDLPRPDVWFVDASGGNVEVVISDAKQALTDQAMPWLRRYSNLRIALRSFESKADTSYVPGIMNEHYGGKVGSLGRARIASVLALELGNKRKAVQIWSKILRDPFYRALDDVREEAQQAIRWIEENR